MMRVLLVAQLVQQLPDPLRLRHQVAGVQPDGAQLVPGEVDGGADGRFDVVRVHQQRGAGAQGGELRLERLAFGVVEQGEGVGGGADGLEAVAPAGFQVGGAAKPAMTAARAAADGGFLVGAPGAHLDAGPARRRR